VWIFKLVIHIDHDGQIHARGGKVSVCSTAEQRLDVRVTRVPGHPGQQLEHFGLDIDGNDTARFDQWGHASAEIATARAHIGNHHARLEVQLLDQQ
jgi:hypothetical protein